ncbi:hypothetical protein DSC_04360 [Pseudoxanthomonas spadix BD-a59]|uniref:Uncharacterized protein n=1 Tax=Pseudoxanthomonas spadix (strain BD-a59) TaxID=1045855 RepID=G7UPA5_PSEUP|nr:hypothetical protein DSC_04360 [Pseudoxanthomonas spadix BD-a59]
MAVPALTLRIPARMMHRQRAPRFILLFIALMKPLRPMMPARPSVGARPCQMREA